MSGACTLCLQLCLAAEGRCSLLESPWVERRLPKLRLRGRMGAPRGLQGTPGAPSPPGWDTRTRDSHQLKEPHQSRRQEPFPSDRSFSTTPEPERCKDFSHYDQLVLRVVPTQRETQHREKERGSALPTRSSDPVREHLPLYGPVLSRSAFSALRNQDR